MYTKKMKRKKWKAAVLAGMMLSLAVGGNAFGAAAKGPAQGPGLAIVQKEEQKETGGYWVQSEGNWYYYDQNGNPCTGWIVDKGRHYYLKEDGILIVNNITPDGYYVDQNGEWYQRETKIFDENFQAPKKFPAVTETWAGKEAIGGLRTKIKAVFEERKIKMTENSIEYLVGAEGKEKVLLGAYKVSDSGSYRLDIGIGLDPGSKEMDEAETYDYMVFKALLYQLTSTPDQLEDAVYSSWEEDNRWNISRTHWVWVGDAWVKYAAGSGYGHYYIYPVK